MPQSPFQPGIEMKDLNLKEMAETWGGPNTTWSDLPVQEQVRLIGEALTSRTFLIDPNSGYMKVWDVVIVLALVFTALVTPFEIAFLKPSFDFLYGFNRFLDLCFLKDMLMQFSLKIVRETKQGTVWVRSRRKIFWIYVKSWFIVDLLSIIPYDNITDVALVSGNNVTGLEKLKIMRLLRVFRLFKLLRILKASRVVKRWENRIGMKSSSKYILKFTMLIVVSCHWMACVWGFFGILEGSNLICRENLSPDDPLLSEFPDRPYFFPDSEHIDPFSPSKWEGHAELGREFRLWARGVNSDGPLRLCDDLAASMYWAIMTITSIGYGDILPITYTEYVVCSVCMMASSILWAYIIGAACAVMSNTDPELTEFEQTMDTFNAMVKDQDLPQSIRYRGREYLREERFHKRYVRNMQAARQLSKDLQGCISRRMASHYLDQIWFFQGTPMQLREDVAYKFTPFFYERREIVAQVGRLCVVERGAVGHMGRILVPWAYWGADMLLRNSCLQRQYSSVSLTYTEIVCLTRDELFAVLDDHPTQLIGSAVRAVRIYLDEKDLQVADRDPAHAWILDVIANAEWATIEEARKTTEAGDEACKVGTMMAEDPVDVTLRQSIAVALAPTVDRLEQMKLKLERVESLMFAEGHFSQGTTFRSYRSPWEPIPNAAQQEHSQSNRGFELQTPATDRLRETGGSAPFARCSVEALHSSCSAPSSDPPEVAANGAVSGGRQVEPRQRSNSPPFDQTMAIAPALQGRMPRCSPAGLPRSGPRRWAPSSSST
eukprot:CAMPEP_0117621248 /NCGR_PEP_ID=MMETSP0784-20121206/87539_1 /TAXON_ID=39447 /ORGANISM="" /LENGTH=773 /DNA_ID=CAMNT_0005425173 /DNA_START=167 /DNA_END=2490 /DNA_ORIENTATION=-